MAAVATGKGTTGKSKSARGHGKGKPAVVDTKGKLNGETKETAIELQSRRLHPCTESKMRSVQKVDGRWLNLYASAEKAHKQMVGWFPKKSSETLGRHCTVVKHERKATAIITCTSIEARETFLAYVNVILPASGSTGFEVNGVSVKVKPHTDPKTSQRTRTGIFASWGYKAQLNLRIAAEDLAEAFDQVYEQVVAFGGGSAFPTMPMPFAPTFDSPAACAFGTEELDAALMLQYMMQHYSEQMIEHNPYADWFLASQPTMLDKETMWTAPSTPASTASSEATWTEAHLLSQKNGFPSVVAQKQKAFAIINPVTGKSLDIWDVANFEPCRAAAPYTIKNPFNGEVITGPARC